MSPQWPGFVSGSDSPISYRADRERTINLYIEKIESQHGPNTAFLRRRPGLLNFAGLVTEGGLTSSVNYLLAGGGGGYGNTGVVPGGGGAGQLVEGSVNLTVAAYPIVIGQGGAVSTAGTSSTWNGVTALGGGQGGEDTVNDNGGFSGASGGGAATSYFTGSTWIPFTGGTGTAGFNGGDSDLNAGAGGGGAGGAGQTATQNNGGAGGPGVLSDITGASVLYASGGAGVGLTTRGVIPGGVYGSGGSSSELDPGHSPIGNQVEAQDGVVIIRYVTGRYTATGGAITTSGLYTIHTFTTNGTFTVTDVVPTPSTTAGGGGIHYCPAQGRCFVISTGGTLYEIFTDGSLTNYGSVATGAFRPRMTDNGTFNQMLIVAGYTLYIFDLSTNVLTPVTSDQIDNPVVADFSDGYFLILNTLGVLQWSAPGDGTTWDALDIAKNSATADPWVSMLVVHREIWLFGSQNGQIWVDTGNTDQPFEMAPGSVMHQGVIAPFTLQRCDNSSFWVGQNDQGRCVVFRANGYTPTRVSTHAVELAIGRSTQLESAIACVFQSQGHTFYQLYVPDIQTCWVYDVSTELWCEWALLVQDTVDPWTWEPWPVQMATFAFGKNLVVGPDTALVAQLAWDEEDDDSGGGTGLDVNSICFSGFGDSGTFLFYSPAGVDLGQPPSNPSFSTSAFTSGMGAYSTGVIFQQGFTGTPPLPGVWLADFSSVVNLTTPDAAQQLRGGCCDHSGNAYCLMNKGGTATTSILKITPAGVVSIVTTVPYGDLFQWTNLGVNPAGTIAYLIKDLTTPSATLTILKVTLPGGVATTFVTATLNSGGGYWGGNCNPLVFADGSVLIPWGTRTSAGFPKLYSSTGTLITTYTNLTGWGTVGGHSSPTSASYVYTDGDGVRPVDPDSFILGYYRPGLSTESGVTVSQVPIGGTADIHSFDPDNGDFEFDGPFTALRGGEATNNLIEPAIRWLRRTPHGVNELKRVFYSRLDLLMDTGVGVGSNPPIYMRYSNDGTQTWNTAKLARYGQVGQTTKRVYWTPLGSARDRVFEVYGDAMQPLRIVDAYIELSPGTT